MVWNFLKKILNKKDEKRPEAEPRAAFRQQTQIQQAASPVLVTPPTAAAGGGKQIVGSPAAVPPAEKSAPVKEKSPAEKTDEELVLELNAISPEILSQAKTPQTRKLIIDIYRKMLIEGVDINDEKEVKKWLKKHPEVVNGGDAHKIETFKREEPKVGRNDACPCGSGKKYKKCCGQGK